MNDDGVVFVSDDNVGGIWGVLLELGMMYDEGGYGAGLWDYWGQVV